MHTSDLNWISQNVAEFGGAIPSDAILHTVRNRFYIVNTEPSHLPGSHWVCIYNGKVPEFFDSLGKDPSFYDKKFEATSNLMSYQIKSECFAGGINDQSQTFVTLY